MIVTFTPNPALDMTYTVASLEHGESQHVDAARMRAGGKGLNVARVVHQLGFGVTAVATAGGETGREFAADLAGSGFGHRLVSVAAPTRRSVAIVDTGRDETTLLNERGRALAEEDWVRLNSELASLVAGAECVTGSGSLPPGAPASVYAELVTMASDRHVPSVIDATGPALLRAAEAGATALKPNRRELSETTGENDPVAGAARLIELGASLVFVSLGEAGMIAVDAHGASSALHARLPDTLAGNPTGAGDAAVAAIAVSLAEQITDTATLLTRATAWSAAAVLMPQAGEIAGHYRDFEAAVIFESAPR